MAWFDDRRFSPYVSVSVSIDFGAARAYLDVLRPAGPVSIQALLIASIGRLYRDFPQANCRIIGGRIYEAPEVGVAAPVNLIGHAGEGRMPLSMMVLEKVDQLSLREVAAANQRTVQGERGGAPANPFVRGMLGAAERAPLPALHRVVDGLHRFYNSPALASAAWRVAPASVGISNVGATFGGNPNGMLFRGGAVNLPTRPVHVGSLFGVSGVQDEVVARDGVPTVRPMLPILYVFDHRLFDGFLASRILQRFGEILVNPVDEFGTDGTRKRS